MLEVIWNPVTKSLIERRLFSLPFDKQKIIKAHVISAGRIRTAEKTVLRIKRTDLTKEFFLGLYLEKRIK